MSDDAIKALAGLDAARRAGWARYYAAEEAGAQLRAELDDTYARWNESSAALEYLYGMLAELAGNRVIRIADARLGGVTTVLSAEELAASYAAGRDAIKALYADLDEAGHG